MNWENIPAELVERDQWCLAAPPGYMSEKGKEPLTIDQFGQRRMASATSPSTWLSFAEATRWAAHFGYHIGYMLNADDPFSVIDLDVKDATNAPDKPQLWTTREEFSFFDKLLATFISYSETSAGGKGVHIWVKGKIGRGVHKRGIEIYSQERFMICTGKLVRKAPIMPYEDAIQSLSLYLKPSKPTDIFVLEEIEEEWQDFYILQTAVRAENSDKFIQLWTGDWEGITEERPRFVNGVLEAVDHVAAYPSQSEADLALLSMFTFYSPSNAQVRRLFRASALGQREKAQRDDVYINRTLAKIRAREERERALVVKPLFFQPKKDEIDLVQEEIDRMQGGRPIEAEIVPLTVPGQGNPVAPSPNTAAIMASQAPVNAAVVAAEREGGMPWPPGIVGKVAQFIYQSSYLPVKEISIAASLGFMAGICGKGWHIPQSGLNQYINLIALSGVGKEAMHSGIALVTKIVATAAPEVVQFVTFDKFASGPALTKFIGGGHYCFVNVNGEWGKTLKRMAKAESSHDASIEGLRQVMTDLYQKSGPGSIVGGIAYSDKEKNTAHVTGAAYSMIGETTPETFYESLTPDMMSDGFLSRFISILVTTDRPNPNPRMIMEMEPSLIEALAAIAVEANKTNIMKRNSARVERDEAAAAMLKQYEDYAADMIRGNKDNNAFRQMWNRAALKALRLAALLAVADNHLYPVVTGVHAAWAIDTINRDIAVMSTKITEGEVGIDDETRTNKVMSVLAKYVKEPLPPSFIDLEKLHGARIVPRRYIDIYCRRSNAFMKHRAGHQTALNYTIQNMIDNGFLREAEKSKLAKDFGFSGKAYQILRIETGA